MRRTSLVSVSLFALVAAAGAAFAQGTAMPTEPVKPQPIPTGGAPAAQTPPEGTAVPKIEVQATVELGNINDEKKVEQQITFKNVGNAPLEILGVRGSCGCTVPSLDKLPKRTFAPGEGGSFSVEYNPHGRKGPQQTIVYIKTNDPMVPEAQVQIKSVVKPLVSLDPQVVSLGAIAREKGSTATFKINSLVPDLKIVQATAGNPNVVAEVLETVKATVEGEETNQTTIKLTVPANLPNGPFNDMVTIRTSDAARTLYASITGDVQGNFVVQPQVLSLQQLTAAAPINSMVRVSSRSGQPFKILGVTDSPRAGSANFKFEVVEDTAATPAGSAYIVKITGTTPEQGAVTGAISINTDQPAEPTIGVNYTGFVRPKPQAAQPAARDPWKDQPSTLVPR